MLYMVVNVIHGSKCLRGSSSVIIIKTKLNIYVMNCSTIETSKYDLYTNRSLCPNACTVSGVSRISRGAASLGTN